MSCSSNLVPRMHFVDAGYIALMLGGETPNLIDNAR
jgi:hypothetical protein